MSGPGPDPDGRLRRSWEANAEAWTGAVRGGSIGSRRAGTDDAILAAVLEHDPRTVLDVGCGEGWLTRALEERGVAAVGVDGSAPLVAAANEAGGGRFLHRSYGELARDPRSVGGPFDVVACNFSLLGEPLGPLLTAFRSLLGRGGVLVVQTVHPWVASEGEYEDGWRTERFETFGAFPEPMPWYFRTLGSWTAALAEGGFVVTSIREPRHRETGKVLSLLVLARAA